MTFDLQVIEFNENIKKSKNALKSSNCLRFPNDL